ncbi:hypothetical protein RFI_23957 [Reticulomyxa filosa]|uniref:Uncharacterized protein n=1 Tax=Reticulomyxa filosa TaxID=46433 RepID=X6MJ25_RETFI|nr:hypothetical protein RFI_23957 [Reticulomyxa filosa]|eukprot:ETO13417.1 hypothetical protein RFI_23957 [Reticulomyxa filosa]
MKTANEVEELTKQVNEYDKALSEAHQKHKDLQAQIEELHTENLEKDKINQQLTQELGRTRMHLTKKLQSTDRLKTELEELEKEFNEEQDLQPPAYMRNKTVKFRRLSKDLQKHLTVEKGEWQNLVDSIGGGASANSSVAGMKADKYKLMHFDIMYLYCTTNNNKEWELEYDDEYSAEHAKETEATAEEVEAEKLKNREQMKQEVIGQINMEWQTKWEAREQEWKRKQENIQKESNDQQSIALAKMQKEFEKDMLQLKDTHNLQLQQLQDDNHRLQSQLTDSKQKQLDKTKSRSEACFFSLPLFSSASSLLLPVFSSSMLFSFVQSSFFVFLFMVVAPKSCFLLDWREHAV